MMSPGNFAHQIGVKDGNLVEVAVTDTAKDPLGRPIRRELVLPALIVPGHVDNSVTIPLGYGRKHTGPVGEEAGFNAYLLRTSSNPHFIVADKKAVASVKVKKSRAPMRSRRRRSISRSKAAASCARRRSSIIAPTTNS